MNNLIVKKFNELSEKELDYIINVHYSHWVKFNSKLSKENTTHKFKYEYSSDGLPFGISLFDGKNLVGFCTFKIKNLVKYPEIYPWLSDVMILKEFRNKGYGRKLITYAENILKEEGFSKIYIWTDQAPDFYKKLGFKFIKEIEKNEGGIGLLFAKTLNNTLNNENEELLDTYDLNGNFLGIKTKSYCHSNTPNCYHKPVWIWIINDKGEILVQKRANSKKTSPNKWDMPSAGHVIAGETLIDACKRETEEELGLKTKDDDFIFLKEWLYQKNWELAQIYLLKTKAKLQDFILQKGEVSMVKYLKYNEFVNLIHSNEFCNHDRDYKNWICEEIKKFI